VSGDALAMSLRDRAASGTPFHIREEDFAHHRKLFLTEQGYSYQVVVADES